MIKDLNYSVVRAASEHLLHLAANMRAADRREVWAANRHTPYEALALSLEYSPRAWTAFIDEQPALMWGVAEERGLIRRRSGRPWLLATDELERQGAREFIRRSRAYVEKMRAGYRRLENYVHADNERSRRWLAWCGFTVEEEAVLINKEKFHLFWLDNNQFSADPAKNRGGPTE